ncbi:hypothetical protein RR46_06924 [Papilio xuthus]|uniref:Uncharacterized protein n=1 Tax=Papilio xuthus TaxID=66420 RepID=A0A194PYG1_PAPXU|nr:hypothetical protein RR46_06924 [Papilio xuthus]
MNPSGQLKMKRAGWRQVCLPDRRRDSIAVYVPGKRRVGRSKKSWLRNIREWTGVASAAQLFRLARDKGKYGELIANLRYSERHLKKKKYVKEQRQFVRQVVLKKFNKAFEVHIVNARNNADATSKLVSFTMKGGTVPEK